MRSWRKIAATTLTAAALLFGATVGEAGAHAELFGDGWRETDDGVVHCVIGTAAEGNPNQIVCDRYGPGGAWYAQGVVNLWFPDYCAPTALIGGSQYGARARLRLGGAGTACALGIYPSTTQAFARINSAGQRVDYAGLLELRPHGTNGGGPGVELHGQEGCSSSDCSPGSRYLDIIIG